MREPETSRFVCQPHVHKHNIQVSEIRCNRIRLCQNSISFSFPVLEIGHFVNGHTMAAYCGDDKVFNILVLTS